MMMDGLLMAALALVPRYLQVAAAGDIRGDHQSRGPPTRPAPSGNNYQHIPLVRYQISPCHCHAAARGRTHLHHVTMVCILSSVGHASADTRTGDDE